MSREIEQLEYEAEATRLRLSATVSELRGRLTPGYALDEILAYGRDGAAGDFMRNLGRDVARNPLPITLAGAGLAWLMLARNGTRQDAPAYNGGVTNGTGFSAGEAKARVAAAGESVAHTAEELGSELADGSARATSYIAEQAQAAAGGIASAAASARESTASAYRAVSDRARDVGAAVGDKTRLATGRANELGRNVVTLCKEQPLVLAGIGLALGALVGALLPRTETEDRFVGEAADQVKNSGAALAQETFEAAKTAVRDNFEAPAEHSAASEQAGRDEVPAAMATGSERGLT